MTRHHHTADTHPMHCTCEACEPYVPSVPRVRHAADRIGLQVLAGVGVGLGLCAIADLVTGNAGVLGMMGL